MGTGTQQVCTNPDVPHLMMMMWTHLYIRWGLVCPFVFETNRICFNGKVVDVYLFHEAPKSANTGVL